MNHAAGKRSGARTAETTEKATGDVMVTRVFNLQRDPGSGEMFAIGKSERPYSFDEVRALEAGVARGDRAAWAAIIDVDLGLDEDGRPATPELIAARRKQANRAGWPSRAGAFHRKWAWERTQAQRRRWRSWHAETGGRPGSRAEERRAGSRAPGVAA